MGRGQNRAVGHSFKNPQNGLYRRALRCAKSRGAGAKRAQTVYRQAGGRGFGHDADDDVCCADLSLRWRHRAAVFGNSALGRLFDGAARRVLQRVAVLPRRVARLEKPPRRHGYADCDCRRDDLCRGHLQPCRQCGAGDVFRIHRHAAVFPVGWAVYGTNRKAQGGGCGGAAGETRSRVLPPPSVLSRQRGNRRSGGCTASSRRRDRRQTRRSHSCGRHGVVRRERSGRSHVDGREPARRQKVV